MFGKLRMSVDDYIIRKLLSRGKDEQGREIPDPVPMAPPIGYVEQPNLWEQMREMVRREMSAAAEAAGAESFEEADDFDVDDDLIPVSPYENIPDDLEPPIPSPSTGVPPPSGGGKGGGEPPSSPEPEKPKEVTPPAEG